jgi:hypothetical protein
MTESNHGTYYDSLGVAPDVDAVELRRAYLALAQRHHPDRPGGDADRMRAVNEAWATLGDPVRRQRYDAALGAGRPHTWSVRTDDTVSADDPFAHERFDRDLDDGDPLSRPAMVMPRWLALVPVCLFASSLVLFGLGAVVGAPALLAVALMSFTLSTMLFFAAPFIALYAGRRANR